MEKKTIKGLREVQNKYQSFFIDLWGVVHNGIELYSGAIEVLENLNKLQKRYVLMSNAPRPSKSVQKYDGNSSFRFRNKELCDNSIRVKTIFIKFFA